MSSSEQNEQQETLPGLNEAAEQIVRGLQALANLAELAMRDRNAQVEAQRQVGVVAQALMVLARQPQATDLSQALSPQSNKLIELSELTKLELPPAIDPALGMSEEEAERRLTLTTPPALREHSDEEEGESTVTDKRRLIIASLEQLDSALSHTATAINSFDRERWEITNLGNNVPIMALMSNVQEIRPGVLVLVIARGQMIAETARLIDDLKKTFLGLRVVAVGEPFGRHTHLGERLGADFYAPEVEKAAELAEQALTPLIRLAEPLALSLEDAPVEELREEETTLTKGEAEEAPPIDEVPTVKVEGEKASES